MTAMTFTLPDSGRTDWRIPGIALTTRIGAVKQEIGDELCADESTIRRWNKTALSHVVLPEKAISIGNGSM